ncbi:hypothetical protein SLEP1_g12926 [Rubroshorea leprosula]|uniref:Uncharacterized protein n=1 Tax=Rubroshorea leprosula TaxID=152421 RepID=A0AAV5IPG2_9ROSI|nr:hypothetical protein SLEP1_g12926 [Rubroshorea leprosula]
MNLNLISCMIMHYHAVQVSKALNILPSQFEKDLQDAGRCII